MIRRSVLVSLTIVACAGSHAKQLPDGSYAIECDAQKVCLDRAERQCGPSGYTIIGGEHGTKLGGGPGDQKLVQRDQLHIRCKPDPLGQSLEGAQPTPQSVENPPATATPVAVKTSICRPGETQNCVGPGACTGGQACNSDGSGFGPCDCGK